MSKHRKFLKEKYYGKYIGIQFKKYFEYKEVN